MSINVNYLRDWKIINFFCCCLWQTPRNIEIRKQDFIFLQTSILSQGSGFFFVQSTWIIFTQTTYFGSKEHRGIQINFVPWSKYTLHTTK